VLDSETPPLSRSSLVHRGPSHRSLPGRLCPNAPVAEGLRYDEATRGGFVLVTSVPLQCDQRAALLAKGAEVLVVSSGSALATWLEEANARAALVRPDLTVMAAGRDVGELCALAPRFTVGGGAKAYRANDRW
jgi:3-(3-hydroxy-phenyl)propionate hydroxylase